MALQGGGGGGGHHGGGHGGHGFYSGYAPPWAQVGYPVAYNIYYGANQCPDTYCPVHDDKCVCSCSYRRPLREAAGGGMFGPPPAPHFPHSSAYGFKSAHGVPLPAEVWWAMRCPDSTCAKHNSTCDCTCPFRTPKARSTRTASWEESLGAIDPFTKALGVATLLVVGAAFVLPVIQKALK
jgi:hypothetical protein